MEIRFFKCRNGPREGPRRPREYQKRIPRAEIVRVSIIFSPNGALGGRFVEIQFLKCQKGPREGPRRPRECRKRIPRAEVVRVSIIFNPNGVLGAKTGVTKSAIFSAETRGSKCPVGSGRAGSRRKRGTANEPLPNAPRKKIRRSGTPLTPINYWKLLFNIVTTN